MILLDANLLVYSYVSSLPEHEAARTWLDERLNGSDRVGLPWVSLLAFVRLVSNPRIFEKPALTGTAWAQVQDWLECPPAWIPEVTDRHHDVLNGFMTGVVNRSSLVTDAHLAALAIEHGLVLCSSDGDFARFPGLKWENPIG